MEKLVDPYGDQTNPYLNKGNRNGYGITYYKTITKRPIKDTDLPSIGVAAKYKYKDIIVAGR